MASLRVPPGQSPPPTLGLRAVTAAAGGGEEAAAPGALGESLLCRGRLRLSATALQWSGFFVVDVSFYPKSPRFLGKYEAKCFQKGVTRLPGNMPTPSRQGDQPVREEAPSPPPPPDPALGKMGRSGSEEHKAADCPFLTARPRPDINVC